ncbi:MAG: OFA family MFS transporter [Proteobacteria bacterium]|nr:OFA family MFS transporter [Pseudomonadota bacterium]
MSEQMKNKGWTVVLAGTAINLALGILYTWSIFKGEIRASIESGAGLFQWDLASINDPYAVCCLVFAFTMIVAGKCQDRIGPRFTAMIGGLLVGIGFIMISQTTSYWGWVLGFGVLVGAGLGFGYSSATPPALKWFPPAKTGLVAGIVVSGFGLASVYIAPLAQYLLKGWGLQTSMLIFGIAFAVVVCVFANLLVNPPQGYSVAKAAPKKDTAAQAATHCADVTPSRMMKSVDFYLLWLIYFIGAGAGLMVIGSVAGMAKKSLGEMAFVAVALVAVGNAAGRIVAGMLSDRIGRSKTLIIMLLFQALLMFAAIPVVGSASTSAVVLVLLAAFIGFNYGTNLALFPSFAKDLWGLKNFGTNYGILFTAWGMGGFVMGRVSQMIQASTGSYNMSFMIAGTALVVGAGLTLKLGGEKAMSHVEVPQGAGLGRPRLHVNHNWMLRTRRNQ